MKLSDHATHLVGLWVDNDYGLYTAKIDWLDRSTDISHDTVRVFVEGLEIKGLYDDLATHDLTMDSVDWASITEDWKEELREREENC